MASKRERKAKVMGVPERVSEPHKDVYYDHFKARRKMRRKPTDQQVLNHLDGLVRQFGAGALEPFEVRLRAELRGEPVPQPPPRLGGCQAAA